MTEGHEHDPAAAADPAPGLIWLVGLLGALVLVIFLLGLTALYYHVKAEAFQREVVDERRVDVLALRGQQEALLAGPPRFVERQEQGETVRAYVIPIERAMQQVVQEAKAGGEP